MSSRGIAIMGATATGKSRVAIELAEEFDGEIVSMDSRQVYRGLDIGTAKVSSEDRSRVPHHLIDILEPNVPNSAGRHVELARRSVAEIRSRARLPIIAGGTGLYFRAFFRGLIDVAVPAEELGPIRRELDARTTPALYDELSRVDPARARQLSPNDRVRISRSLEIYYATGQTHTEHVAAQEDRREWDGPKIVLTMARPELRRRISERTEAMFRRGWVDEVKSLLDGGLTLESPAMKSLGYEAIAEAILKGLDPYATRGRVVTVTQQYAKRQETFFRSVPGAEWIDVTQGDPVGRIRRLVKKRLGL